ncbi:hypothetical protein JTB14_012674 [Gonioctena quinquepunctata]|nr:hypothetical protein JTB14_012674 [Gonioctena quinquepunctata]
MNNIIQFEKNLENEDWSKIDSARNFDEAFETFYNTFMYHFDGAFPTETFIYRDTVKKWVDSEVIRSSGALKDLYILQKIYPNLGTAYKESKRKHISLIKQKRKCHYQNRISNAENNTKASWEVVADLTNKHKGIHNITLNLNGYLEVDPNKVAEEFNNSF